MEPASTGPAVPILQQIFDCSDGQVEISGLALVTAYAWGSPDALVWHDALAPAVETFLAQVGRALRPRFPGLRVWAQSLGEPPAKPAPLAVRFDGEGAARLDSVLREDRLDTALGLCATEIDHVVQIAMAAYGDFTPTLPPPAELGPAAAGIDLLTVHDHRLRASGYLLRSPDRRAALILHDLAPGSGGAINRYLGATVARTPELASLRLSEHSLREAGDECCRVEPCTTTASRLPVRSTTSCSLAETARMIGLQPARLARLVDQARGLRRWRSPYASARRLQISDPGALLSPPRQPGPASSRRQS